jgi:cell division protein FtsW
MSKTRTIDKPLFFIVLTLTVIGFIIFLSASLGLTAKSTTQYSSVVFNQFFLGLILGVISCFVFSKIHYIYWRKFAFWIFITSILISLLVFIPHVGIESGGAHRWIYVGHLSFQPSEFLKIAFILFMAMWFSNIKKEVGNFKEGFLPFIIFSAIVSIIILAQKDTDTLIVMLVSITAMYLVAGAKWKHLFLLFLIGLIGLSGLVIIRPYIRERILTFINPMEDPLDSGYQIQQSLIAINSGKIWGRGFGQSLQKFNFLPEPIGDSIFAVAAEEFGFIGSLFIIGLFCLLGWRGLKIASNIKDPFGGLVTVGIVILVVAQSFLNMGAMLGVIPLSGLPLLFISHGGTALFFTLTSMGILFNISKYQTKK